MNRPAKIAPKNWADAGLLRAYAAETHQRFLVRGGKPEEYRELCTIVDRLVELTGGDQTQIWQDLKQDAEVLEERG